MVSGLFPRIKYIFPGQVGGKAFALAHNGVLCNEEALRRSQRLPVTRIETDSYLAVQLLERSGKLCPEALAQMAEAKSSASYPASISRRSSRSGTPWRFPYSSTISKYSSCSPTADALDVLGLSSLCQSSIPITQGDIMAIDAKGQRTVTRSEHPVVGQGKRFPSHLAGKGMVIVILAGRSLGGHPGVAG